MKRLTTKRDFDRQRVQYAVWLTFALGLAFGAVSIVADIRYEARGGEFSLTGGLVGDQVATRMAIGKLGGYLVWQDNATDESGQGVSALRLDAASNPVGAPIRINTTLEGNQEKPAVGLFPDGGAIFAWEGGESAFHRVSLRLASPDGIFLGKELPVTALDSGEQIDPVVAIMANGVAVVAWTDFLVDSSHKGVSARLFDANGKPLGDEFRLNDHVEGNQHQPALVALPDGGFAAVWISDQQQNAQSVDAVIRVFSANGTPLSGETILNEPGISARPSIGLAGTGTLVALWEHLDMEKEKPENRWDVVMRSLDLGGQPAGEAAFVNLHRSGDQFSPQVQGSGDGALLIWNSIGQDGSREAVMGRFVGPAGALDDQEFTANTTSFLGQVQPAVAADNSGKFVVAWSSPVRGRESLDLFGQRYQAIDDSVGEGALGPIAKVFVSPLGETELMVSWPGAAGLDVAHYEVYINDIAAPKRVDGNYIIWKGLRAGSEYAFRVAYQLKNGRRSELSGYGVNKTWGRDFNRDGLPDDWQKLHWGQDAAGWSQLEADPDDDGAANLDEFLAGTDPTDTDSALRLRVSPMERGRRLTWKAVPGSVYQVEQSAAVADVTWENIGQPVLAVDSTAGLSIEGGGQQRFYRIRKIR